MRNEDTWRQLWHPEEQRGTVGAAEGEKRHGANRRGLEGGQLSVFVMGSSRFTTSMQPV